MMRRRQAFSSSTSSLLVNKGIGGRIRKIFRRPQQSQLPLDDILSDLQFQAKKIKIRARLQLAAMQEKTEQEAAVNQETQLLKDVTGFAYNLTKITGASLQHPCIRRLLEVADGSLDPRKLLALYKSAPSEVAIVDRQDPGRCWLLFIDPKYWSEQDLLALSRVSALQALVGKYEYPGRNKRGFMLITRDTVFKKAC